MSWNNERFQTNGSSSVCAPSQAVLVQCKQVYSKVVCLVSWLPFPRQDWYSSHRTPFFWNPCTACYRCFELSEAPINFQRFCLALTTSKLSLTEHAFSGQQKQKEAWRKKCAFHLSTETLADAWKVSLETRDRPDKTLLTCIADSLQGWQDELFIPLISSLSGTSYRIVTVPSRFSTVRLNNFCAKLWARLSTWFTRAFLIPVEQCVRYLGTLTYTECALNIGA